MKSPQPRLACLQKTVASKARHKLSVFVSNVVPEYVSNCTNLFPIPTAWITEIDRMKSRNQIVILLLVLMITFSMNP